jgi:hypothetical protein
LSWARNLGISIIEQGFVMSVDPSLPSSPVPRLSDADRVRSMTARDQQQLVRRTQALISELRLSARPRRGATTKPGRDPDMNR